MKKLNKITKTILIRILTASMMLQWMSSKYKADIRKLKPPDFWTAPCNVICIRAVAVA
jgi:hypothetical protein